ncbi:MULTISPECIES: LPS assembly lipoprotein LptE [Nonlabens]|uniref:Lipoprotein n=1 Tax=Nonlabens agnitus TaxID=870484 RepID=A0A2S9WXK9_9FLAO|nr:MULTISPECIES: LptE family protein [Nonlabens]KQC32782.1 lipoprotein [Nonlabens sp. YIK11]PRP68204.1 hypothetical protein BST86_14470 [Nonlabens agnitus]
MTFKIIRISIALLLAISLQSCGFYRLNAVSIPDNIKTFQVDYFGYTAVQTEVGIERTFTLALQDLIQDQSSLTLVTSNGDYIYQGEITRYYISPITATANNRASQNRLTIDINVRFINTKNDEESFEKPYSFYYDYDANTILQNAALDTALEVIFTQITQDIFNDTLAKW